MLFLLNKIISLIIGGLICILPGEKSTSKPVKELPQGFFCQQVSEAAEIKGYRDIIFYNGKFIAVGTDGRIDYINKFGERTPVVTSCRNNLNCVVGYDQMLVVAGNDGTILVSPDGQVFSRAESGTNIHINGIIVKNGLFIAGADKGTILLSVNGKSWSYKDLPVKGNILSLAADDSFCIGVTDIGEIIRSDDGINWTIFDYNKEYSGYNRPCKFRKVIVTANRIVLIGIHDDGSPAVLFSTLGNVWTERSLIYYDNHGMISFMLNDPNDITYDSVRDQFILACDNGELFTLPSCTKCNVSNKVSSNDLFTVLFKDNILISAGEEFYIKIINL